MRAVAPAAVDSITSTTAVNEYADWSSGSAPYAEGARVVNGEFAWEAQTSTSEEPVEGAEDWVKLGVANEWRMFREGRDSQTVSSGDGVTLTVEVPFVLGGNTVAAVGIQGDSIRFYLDDPIDGVVYDNTIDLVDAGAGDWWEYYFTDYVFTAVAYDNNLPPYSGAQLGIEVEATGQPAAVGRAVFGQELILGETVGEVGVKIEDYSRKERDVFGNLSLTERRTIQILEYTFVVEPDLVASVRRRFEALAAQVTLFVGETDLPETIVLGVYERWDTLTDSRTICECSATVEEY